MIEFLIVYGPTIVVLIFVAVMLIGMLRSSRRTKRYYARLDELQAVIANPDAPMDARKQAASDLINCTPESFK